jgi:PAT family beta-lactamase induction signal transducer AmpG
MRRFNKIMFSPWLFVPMLFAAVGAGGGGLVGNLTTVMFKDFGFSNALIGAVALLSLPSSLRFLWAPWVDGLGSKQRLCVWFTFVMGIIILALGGLVYFGWLSPLVAFLSVAVFSMVFSCLEVASDGYYIRIFNKEEQAEFVGVKTAAIRGGIILSIAVFIRLAGEWQEQGLTKEAAWGRAVLFAGAVLLGLALYYRFGLPAAEDDQPVRDSKAFPLLPVLREYVTQPRAWAIILMLLIFRLGQGMQVYMVPPFLMDTVADGGYGMSPKDIALLKTFADMPFMILGGIIGGLIIKRYGIRRTLVPFTLLMNVPNFSYIYLSLFRPEASFTLFGHSFYGLVFGTAVVETLGYGIGFSAFYYYLHAMAEGRHKTSMLAISSGLMGLGFYLPGGISGILQQSMGYPSLFVLSSVTGLLTLAIIPFLPMPHGTK